MKNLLEQFLDEIEIRYNRCFADKLYNEHPYRYNMYGLKKMLDVYGVKTVGVRIESKDLLKLNYPCILHTHGNFAIGVDCTDKKITYILHNRKAETTLVEFKQTWTGNALVVEETTEAVEPNFDRHRRDEWLNMAKTYCIPSLLIIAAITGLARNFGIMNLYQIANIFMSSIGIIVCALLMQKQLLGESHYGDKVCSLFHQADCNSILDGSKAKVFGISWSEVGMGFFIVNILLLSLYPKTIGVIMVINWMAMLYGVWSIYYQWRIAQNWCVLCVIVQAIVWTTGVVAIMSSLNDPFCLPHVVCIYVCMAYAMSIMSVHFYAALHTAEHERIQAVQQYKAIKVNGSVAKTLIEQGKYYETSLRDSSIVFGNIKAKLRVTILSNPHCNPCARMHKRVEKLLHINKGDVCVQYIFSSFNKELEDSSLYLISCFLDHDETEALRKFALWYSKEKYDYKKVMAENEANIRRDVVKQEMEKHRIWREKTSLIETPTVLVNGYMLPAEYTLEDLSMIVDAKILEKNILQDINSRSTTLLGAERPSAEEAV